MIVRRGLARRSGAGRWTSVAFGLLVLAAVAAGLAHATGALAELGPVSAMQVHMGAALAALPLLAWHAPPGRGQTPPHRPVPPGPAPGRDGRRRGRPAVAGRRERDPPRRPARRQPPLHRVPPGDGTGRRRGDPGAGGRGQDPGYPVAGRPGPGPRPGRLAAPGRRRGHDPRVDLRRAGGLRRPDRGGPGLHRRLVRPGHLGGCPPGPPAPARRRRGPATGHPPGRPSPQRRPRLPGPLVAPGRRGFWWVKWVVSVELDPAPWWRQPPFPLT